MRSPGNCSRSQGSRKPPKAAPCVTVARVQGHPGVLERQPEQAQHVRMGAQPAPRLPTAAPLRGPFKDPQSPSCATKTETGRREGFGCS